MYIADGKTNGPAFSWPDGKRIAVMVTFDYDAEFYEYPAPKARDNHWLYRFFTRSVRPLMRDWPDALICWIP